MNSGSDVFLPSFTVWVSVEVVAMGDEISLAYRKALARLCRGRGLESAIWGLPARGAARQRLQRIVVFPTRLAGAERAQAHV